MNEIQLTTLLDKKTERQINRFDNKVNSLFKHLKGTDRIEHIDKMYELLWDIIIPRQEIAYKLGMQQGLRGVCHEG